jgi:3-keto-disaccharide hydrolase
MLAYRIRAVVLLCLAVITVSVSADQKAFLGRWTLMSTGDRPGAYWLEVKDEGGKLTAKFLNRGGHPLPMENVRVEGEELIFTTPKSGANQNFSEFRGKVSGSKITATLKSGDRTADLSGGRPPSWPASNANGHHTLGKPVVLFEGKSLDAFGVQRADAPMNWSIEDGVMTNGEHANNLVSKEKFKDFKLNAEYKVGPGTNSGIYLRGRYELQVLDDFGKPPFDRGHMAIYGWKAPPVNSSKPAGEWQTVDVTVVGNRVTVVHNGQKIHDNAVLEAITGGALDIDEAAPGPIMIQGDHSKVWFRKILVTPITRAGT